MLSARAICLALQFCWRPVPRVSIRRYGAVCNWLGLYKRYYAVRSTHRPQAVFTFQTKKDYSIQF
eukprot:4047557-Amphidinium_carterae.1